MGLWVVLSLRANPKILCVDMHSWEATADRMVLMLAVLEEVDFMAVVAQQMEVGAEDLLMLHLL